MIGSLERTEIERRSTIWKTLSTATEVAADGGAGFIPLDDFLRGAAAAPSPGSHATGSPAPHPPLASPSTLFDVQVGNQTLRGLHRADIEQRAPAWSKTSFGVSVAEAGTQQYVPLATFLQPIPGPVPQPHVPVRARPWWNVPRNQLAAAIALPIVAIAVYFVMRDSPEAKYRKAVEAKQAGNYADAAKLFQSIGTPAAKFNLALLYTNGQGVPQDDARAVELLKSAADQGNPAAQTTLGIRYAAGEGVGHDAALAAEWYGKAAHQGYGWAQMLLGLAYATGDGVTQDYVAADTWFVLAAAGGDPNAAEERDRVELLLSEDERRQATEQANTFAEQIMAGGQS